MKSLLTTFLVCLSLAATAQSKTEEAHAKAMMAIDLMDNGKIEESIDLLNEAIKMDPEKFTYRYELAYANYLKADYKTAIKLLEKVKSHKDVTAPLFQLLGNAYDLTGKPDKGIEVYDEGLKKFPNSGSLYLEKANIMMAKEKYNDAPDLYEKGIEMDPMFPSNYYHASRIFCLFTDEKIWGLFYGEIFMNLERNSKRTAEVSKILYDTYAEGITWKNDTSAACSFTKSATIDASSLLSGGEFKLPFSMIYETNMLINVAVGGKQEMNLAALDKIRSGFVTSFYGSEQQKSYPNVLIEYQKKLQDAGHLEAYNHWILMKGAEKEFNSWKAENKKKWDDFVTWFNENDLEMDENHRFHRTLY